MFFFSICIMIKGSFSRSILRSSPHFPRSIFDTGVSGLFIISLGSFDVSYTMDVYSSLEVEKFLL